MRWTLIGNAYKKIREAVLNNAYVMQQTGIQLAENKPKDVDSVVSFNNKPWRRLFPYMNNLNKTQSYEKKK